MRDVIDLIARIFISSLFFYEAYDSIVYFKSTQQTMTDYGLTWNQDLLLTITICFLIIGASLVLLGYRTALGITILLIYFVPVTIIVYSFWNDPQEVNRLHGIMFMKNLAIIGGLLMLLVQKDGKYRLRRLFQAAKLSKPQWEKVDSEM